LLGADFKHCEYFLTGHVVSIPEDRSHMVTVDNAYGLRLDVERDSIRLIAGSKMLVDRDGETHKGVVRFLLPEMSKDGERVKSGAVPFVSRNARYVVEFPKLGLKKAYKLSEMDFIRNADTRTECESESESGSVHKGEEDDVSGDDDIDSGSDYAELEEQSDEEEEEVVIDEMHTEAVRIQRQIDIKINLCRALEMKFPVLLDLFERTITYPDVFDWYDETSSTSHPKPRFVRSGWEMIVQASHFFAVDGKWMSQWRQYHAKCEDIERPEERDLLNQSRLRCEHGRALIPTEFADISRGSLADERSQDFLSVQCLESHRFDGMPSVELVTEEQWNALLSFRPDVAYRMATRTQTADDEHQMVRSNDAITTCLVWSTEAEEWQWTPEVCQECQRTLQARAADGIFDNMQVTVRVFADESKLFAVGNRQALPSASDYKSYTLKLSSCDTVAVTIRKLTVHLNTHNNTKNTYRFQLFGPEVEFTNTRLTLQHYNFKSHDLLNVILLESKPARRKFGTNVMKK
jgi:hypothetical protein